MDINFDEIQNTKFADPILKKIESVLFYLAQSYASLIKDPSNNHEKIQEFDKELGDFLERYQQLYNITSNLTELELQKIAVEFRTEIDGVKSKLTSGFFKGAPFVYSDFTPAQLEALKVKGDKFVYSDFTPAQLESLRMYNATSVGGKQATDFMQVGFSTQDLNNMKTAGSFRVEGNLLNAPVGVDFGNLLVLRSGNSDTYTQLITDYSSTSIYWRSGSNALGWQSWKRILSDGNALATTPLGYASGSAVGGVVVQVTSKATSVTLNKLTGQITMHNAQMISNESLFFTFYNSFITTNDTVDVNISGGVASRINYKLEKLGTSAGYMGIKLTNVSGGSLSESLQITFNVFKGAIS